MYVFFFFACRLLRELSEIDRNHYPGRGGVIYVINTPPLFGFVWQGIQGFLATQVKCKAPHLAVYGRPLNVCPFFITGCGPLS